MGYRRKMSGKGSRKSFKRHTSSKAINHTRVGQRGGIRL